MLVSHVMGEVFLSCMISYCASYPMCHAEKEFWVFRVGGYRSASIRVHSQFFFVAIVKWRDLWSERPVYPSIRIDSMYPTVFGLVRRKSSLALVTFFFLHESKVS